MSDPIRASVIPSKRIQAQSVIAGPIPLASVTGVDTTGVVDGSILEFDSDSRKFVSNRRKISETLVDSDSQVPTAGAVFRAIEDISGGSASLPQDLDSQADPTFAGLNSDSQTFPITADVLAPSGDVNIATQKKIQFTPGTTGDVTEGALAWNAEDGTIDLGLKGGNVKLQIGQEQIIRVVNKTNSNLTEAGYKVVKVTHAQGQRLAVNLAQANSELNSATVLGLVTEDISDNQEGFITVFGQVRDINTTGSLQGETWLDGDILYLSAASAGSLTKVAPAAPNWVVSVGYVVHAHSQNGSIFVKVDLNLASRLATEESTRASADASLTSRISDQEVTLANGLGAASGAINTVANSVSTETVDRISADGSLSTRISNLTASDIEDTSEYVAGTVKDAIDSIYWDIQTNLSQKPLEVANAAARLNLSLVNAAKRIVRDTDTGISFFLVDGGDPTDAGDWLVISNDASLTTRISSEEVARAAADEPPITAGSTSVDFSSKTRQLLTVSGPPNFTGSNYTVGTWALFYITASGGPYNYTFQSEWNFVTLKPTSIASGKRALLLLESTTTSATGVFASYTEQS